MAGFDAGSVFVKLGFQPEFSGADQYERRADAVRARAAKPIVTDATLDVDPKPFIEHARRSDAAEKVNLKVRDSQLKLEAAQQKATSAEAKHGRESIEYRRAALNVDKATNSLTESQQRLDRTVEKVARTLATDAQRAAEGYSRKIEQAADDTEQAGVQIESGFLGRLKGMAAPVLAAGAAIGAALTKGVTDAVDLEAAEDKLAGQLRLSEEDSARAGRIAGRVYAEAYGESVGEVNDSIRSIVQNLNVSVRDANLEPLTKKLLNLTATFEAESDQVTRTISSLVKNGLAKDVDEAFDMVTAGFQAGMDRGGEFLDTLNEYSAPLAALGLSMEDFIGMTDRGLDAGVYSIDKLGDALKELSIRAIDGSDATKLGFEQIGLSADEYSKAISEGGPAARKATGEIVDALMGVEDKRIQSQAGFALFGAMFEDVKADGIGALKPIDGGLQDVKGRADELNETLGDNNATAWESFKRRASQALTSAGGAVVRLGGDVRDHLHAPLNAVKGTTDDVIGWFRDVYTENADTIGDIGDTFSQVAGIARRAFGDVKDAVDDAFGSGSGTGRDVRKVIGVLLDLGSAALDLWKDVTKRALPGIVDAFRGALRGIRGVVKVITGILTLDFGKVWDGLKDIVSGALTAVGGVIRTGTAPLRELASRMGRAVSSPMTSIWGGIKKAWRSGLDVILGGVSTASGAIASMLDAAGKLPVVGGKFKGLADDVRKGQRAIDEYRESLRKANREQDRTDGIKKMRGEVRDLRERLKGLKRGTDDYRETSEKLRKKQRELNRALGDGESAGRRGARGVERIGEAGGNAATAVYNAADNISTNLIAVSKGLGIKPPSFAVKVPRGQGVSGGGRSSKADAAFVKGHAVGGIPNPGSGVRDDHMLVDPSGRPVAMMSGTEGILNTPQMGIVDHALMVAQAVGESPYGGLNDLWSSGMRHYAGGGLMGANPGLARYANAARPFGVGVSSGHRPGSITSSGNQSQHSTGDAIDLAGPMSGMLAFAREYAPRFGPIVDQFIFTPLGHGYNRGRRVASFGARVDADHLDHIHIGDSTPGGPAAAGGSGGGISSIGVPQVTGPRSAALDIVRGAARRMAKDANSWLDRQSPAADTTGFGAMQGGGQTSAGGAWTKPRLASLWRKHNDNGDPNLMAAIALAESSGNPNVIGIPTSGGRAHGLWQIMWPAHRASFPGRDPLNVDDNAIMAGAILRSQGLGAWEAYTRGMHRKFLATGGPLEYFAKGGKAKSKKPTKASASQVKRARKILGQLWDGTRGYLPGAGSSEPRSRYNASSGLEGATVGMVYDPNGRRAGRYVNWPAWTLQDLAGGNQQRASEMAEVALHEWAHYFQAPHVLTRSASTFPEGGAQAFTRRVAPKVFRALGLPYRMQSRATDSYDKWARHVERTLGVNWVMRDQFDDRAAKKYRYGKGVKGPYGFNMGGLLANVPRFAKGGTPKKKPSFKEATLNRADLGASAFRALRSKQNDRIGRFDRISELLDSDAKRYGITERRNDLTDEVLIDEEFGTVNVDAVKQRAAEMQALADIKRRMTKRLRDARRIAQRVQKTYSTIITRLKRALKAATSGKKGKTSAARKAAAKSYREQIADYLGRRKEWRGKETDLNWDIEDADVDLQALIGERSEVLGTKAESREPDPPLDNNEGGDNGPADNAPTEVQLPPTPEDIARGVAEQFNAFNASRAELFSSFGGNFIRNTLPQSFGGNQDDAGARYFGAGQSGADGVVAAAGGQSGPTEGATIQQNLYFTGPQPPDPHAHTAAALHELQVRV